MSTCLLVTEREREFSSYHCSTFSVKYTVMEKFGYRPTYIICDLLGECWSTGRCCFYYGGMRSRVSLVLLCWLWRMFDVGQYLARSSRVPPHVLLAPLTNEVLTGNHRWGHDIFTQGQDLFSYRFGNSSVCLTINPKSREKVLAGLGDSYIGIKTTFFLMVFSIFFSILKQ